MSDNPGLLHTTNAPARSSARWIWIALAILLLGGAGLWLGDVPNRYRAAEAMKAGRLALLKSDQTAALKAFRDAALARPTDEAIIMRYEQTQETWFEFAERKVAKLDAQEAYLAWRDLPPAEALLMEPALGRYRTRTAEIETAARQSLAAVLDEAAGATEAGDFEHAQELLAGVDRFAALVPDLTERRRKVRDARLAQGLAEANDALAAEKFDDARAALKAIAPLAAKSAEEAKLTTAIGEAELRAKLRDANKAAAGGKLQEAHDLLAQATGLGVLPEEVAKAREEVLKVTRAQVSNALALGISRNDRAKVEAALAQGVALAQWKQVPVDDVVKPANVTGFLETLKAFELGSEHQAKFVDRLDLPLVLWARKNFRDQAGLDDYLRDGFTQWSRALAGQGVPACALYIDELAREFGAKPDAAWRKETLDRVAEAVGVTVSVREPLPDNDAPPKLNAEATAALRAALAKKLGAWPKLVAFDPKQPATVVLSGYYAGFESQDNPTITKRTVRYQSGTRQVRNPEEQQVYDDFADLKQRYDQVSQALAEKQEYVNSVSSNPNSSDWDRSQLTYKNIEIVSDRNLLARWRNELNELRRRGQSLPQSLQEPVYADESYDYIQHDYRCTATWVIQADLHGTSYDVAESEAGTQFRTDEVAGDASHGVPVKAKQPVPKAKLLPGLVAELVQKAANVDSVVKQLPELTVASFANFHRANASDALNQTEQFLGLVYAWQRVGQTLEEQGAIFDRARQQLNLPPLEKKK